MQHRAFHEKHSGLHSVRNTNRYNVIKETLTGIKQFYLGYSQYSKSAFVTKKMVIGFAV